MTSAKPRAYSYARFSSFAQAEGDSLRRQQDAARAFAQDNGLELDEELVDRGISAFRGSNLSEGASLHAFAGRVRAGDIPPGSMLILENLDRFSRQEPYAAISAFLSLLASGVRIATLSDRKVFEPNPNGNEQMMSMLFAVLGFGRAHDESAIKSLRLAAAWSEKRRRAGAEGVPMTRRVPSWLRVADDAFEVIPARGVIVRRIFAEAIAGTGALTIARQLQQDGVPTFGRAEFWRASMVKKTLNNHAAFGRYQPHRMIDKGRVPEGDPIEGYFPPVIDRTTFEAARHAVASRGSLGIKRRPKDMRSVLTRIARCVLCRSSMILRDKGAKGGGPYLVCGKSEARAGCPNATKLDLFELEHLTLFAAGDPTASRLLRAPDEKSRLKDELHAEQSYLLDLETRIEATLELVGDAALPTDLVRRRLTALEQERGGRRAEIERLQTEIGRLQTRTNEIDPVRELIERQHRLQGEELVTLRRSVHQRLSEDIETMTCWPSGFVRYCFRGGGSASSWLRPRNKGPHLARRVSTKVEPLILRSSQRRPPPPEPAFDVRELTLTALNH